MKQLIKKITSLSDLRHKAIFTISFVLSVVTMYLDFKNDPSHVQLVYLIGYALSLIIAGVWAILNYISHMKINSLYKESKDIHVFINQLALSSDEKLEIQTYLEDYIEDQMTEGKTKAEATKHAIDQFKIEEFSTLSKNTALFSLPAHYYLIGYSALALVLGLILVIVTTAIPLLILESVGYISILYGIGFIGFFLFYKMLDVVFHNKG